MSITYLYRWFVEVAQVGRSLSRFLTQYHHVWVNEPKRIDDDLALDTLYGVDNHCDSALGQRLKALLCIDVHTGEPAAKTRMRVVPAYHHLRSVNQDRVVTVVLY